MSDPKQSSRLTVGQWINAPRYTPAEVFGAFLVYLLIRFAIT